MAGNKVGSLKTAAKRVGISPEEYVTHINAGEKWCHKGKHWKAITEYDIDRTRGDEHKAVCQECDYTRIKQGPSKKERRQKRLQELAYCRMCEDWHPVTSISKGLCKEHIREDARHRYANDPDYRRERRQHAHARKRNVDPIPLIGQKGILEEFEGKCAYCENDADTWDHVLAVNKGGKTVPYNIVPACGSCNSSKGDRDVYEWMQSIHRGPTQEFYDRVDLEWCGLF